MKYIASYESTKVRTLAVLAKYLVDNDFEDMDKNLAAQMINIGIRKMHDVAKSSRGIGKYLGHPVWSKSAVKILEDNDGNIHGITKYLSHEHLVPLNIVVMEFLFKKEKGADIADYEDSILKYAGVAIITREENDIINSSGFGKRMPPKWDREDVFARYKEAGLYENLTYA